MHQKNPIIFWLLALAIEGIGLQAIAQIAGPVQAIQSGNSTPVVSYLTGDSADVQTTTSPGWVLAGGSKDVDEAMLWMLQKSGGGDVVIIRSSGADGYNPYLYKLAKVNSVETLVIDSREKALDPMVERRLRQAEALFIAGGDQWNYVKFWKDTPVEFAINYLANEKRIPMGGTSAGLAILGGVYFSAEHGTITSEEALANPYHEKLALGYHDFINCPWLYNTITDSHYSQRKRQGRHIAFLARMKKQMPAQPVLGIGIDEQTAICIDGNGLGTVYGKNYAWFLKSGKQGSEQCKPAKAIHWYRKGKAIAAFRLSANSVFNFSAWQPVNNEPPFYVAVKKGQISTTDSVTNKILLP